MAKPTPLKTASRSINTTQNALEKILVGTNASGKYLKVAGEVRTDVDAIIRELKSVRKGAQQITSSIDTLLEYIHPMTEGAIPQLKRLAPDQVVTFTDLPPVVNQELASEVCTL